jgi:hypothetical protein
MGGLLEKSGLLFKALQEYARKKKVLKGCENTSPGACTINLFSAVINYVL